MVGLSLALLLASIRPSWRIALIESHALQSHVGDTPKTKSFDARSTALAEGSRSILQACGVWAPLAEHLTPITQVHVSDRGHFAGSILNAADFQRESLGYVIENPDFGLALARALDSVQSIELIAPARVQSLMRRQDHWQVHVEGKVIETNLLILADGSASPLGQSLGIQYRIEDYGQTAIIANVEADRPHGGVAYERFTSHGPVALLPLSSVGRSGRYALIWTHPTAHIGPLLALDDKAFCQALQADFGYRAGRFCRVGSRQTYPLRLVLAQEQIRAGLVMMGNAAHFLHPVAGQGFNLALRDCRILSEVIADAKMPGDLALLQRYLDRQQQDQQTTVALGHGLVKLFSTADLPNTLLRSLGLLGLEAIGPAKQLFGQQAMGFSLAGNAGR